MKRSAKGTGKGKGGKRTAKRLPVVLDRGEMDRLRGTFNVKCTTGLRNRAIVEAALGAGLRVSELCNLQRRHIKWGAGIVEVHAGKGEKDRNVPVNQETLGWLKAWDGKRPAGAERYFFTRHDGGQLSPRYLQAMVKRAAVKAGLNPETHPHTLRHSYATDLLDHGFTIREVQELLGHADVSTTMIYTHVRPGALAAKIQGNGAALPAEVKDLAAKLAALPAEARKALAAVLESAAK